MNQENQKDGFLDMVLGTLGDSLSGNLFIGKDVKR